MRGLARGGSQGRRLLLLGVAGLLCASALLAIGILLFGHFGRTEGRILATTALLGGFGLLALPAAILADRGTLRALVVAVVALDLAAASLALAALWSDAPGEALGKTFGTALFLLLAVVQTAALAGRRRASDPNLVRALFRASVLLAALAAALLTGLVWSQPDGEAAGRAAGSLVVLDALAVALQPILARARPAPAPVHLRATVAGGERVELTIDAPDPASAAAKAIRALEREGRHVRLLELD